MAPPLDFDQDGNLLCPKCGFMYVHIRAAMVAGRQEDGEEVGVGVDAQGYITSMDRPAVLVDLVEHRFAVVEL